MRNKKKCTTSLDSVQKAKHIIQNASENNELDHSECILFHKGSQPELYQTISRIKSSFKFSNGINTLFCKKISQISF